MARTCSWGVLLPPRSERPGGSFGDETTALSAVPQPPHGDICRGQVLASALHRPGLLKRMQYRPGLLIGFLASTGLEFGPSCNTCP